MQETRVANVFGGVGRIKAPRRANLGAAAWPLLSLGAALVAHLPRLPPHVNQFGIKVLTRCSYNVRTKMMRVQILARKLFGKNIGLFAVGHLAESRVAPLRGYLPHHLNKMFFLSFF